MGTLVTPALWVVDVGGFPEHDYSLTPVSERPCLMRMR